MRIPFVMLAMVGFLLAADVPLPDKEREKFQGTWQVVSAEINGSKMAEQRVQAIRWAFMSDKFRISNVEGKEPVFPLVNKEIHEGRIRLYPDKQPKAIDILPMTGPEQYKTLLGIYQLDGDKTLKICWAGEGKERPTAFTTKPDTDLYLLVLERAKPKAP